MTETERLRIKLQAAEAEILRLQSGYDDLKQHCELNMFVEEHYDKFNEYHNAALKGVIKEINKITKPL